MKRLGILALGLSLTAIAPTRALAQGATQNSSIERLRALFAKGIALEDEGRWEEALDQFEAIGRERMTPQVRFHIALAEEHLLRLGAAKRHYQEALELAQADPEKAKDVLEWAPKHLEDLEQRIPRVTVVVAGDGRQAVRLDGGEPIRGKGRIQLEVDPGKHKITTDRPAFERAFTLEEESRLEFEVPALPEPGGGDKKPPPPPPPPEEKPVVVPGNKAPAYAVGAAGLAALGGAGVFLALRQVAISDVRDTCSGDDTGCDPALRDTADRGLLYERVSIGLAAGGAALLGVSVALWFTIGADSVTTPAPKQQVWLGPVPGGLRLGGTF